MSDDARHIAIFRQKEIRKQLYHGEWWFVIHDVVGVLTDSVDPAQYLRKMRARDPGISALFDPVEKGAVQIVPPFALTFDTPGGKQKLLSWNTEGIFRLVQSIPSKKAEPFRSNVGHEKEGQS